MIDRCLLHKLGKKMRLKGESGLSNGLQFNKIHGAIQITEVFRDFLEGLDGIFLDPECFVGPPTIKILEGDIILQDPTVPLYLAKTVAVSTEHRQLFALR